MWGLRGHGVPRGTWVNEGCEVQMVTKDLGETVGALERRAPRESLVTRAQLGCWEHVDSQDLRGSLVL